MKPINKYLVSKHINTNNIVDIDNDEFIKTSLLDKCEGVKNVRIDNTRIGKYIYLDYLEPKDYPHGIADNSIILEFIFSDNKLELKRTGHLELTDADKAGKYKYYALKGFTAPYYDAGGKKFRKCLVKNNMQLVKKISEFANNVYQAAIEDQGGELTRKK